MSRYNFTKEQLMKAFEEAGSAMGAARLLNIKIDTYKRYCLKYDCYRTNQSGKGLKRNRSFVEKNGFDIHYFDDINDNTKAYILGYTAADGGIHRNSLRYIISSKDREILDFIANQVNYDKNKIVDYIGYYKKDNIKHEFPCSALYLLSKHLVQTLEKYGIVLNRVKKEINMFEIIDDKYKSSWLAGYIDGNGSWSGYRVQITTNYNTAKEMMSYLEAKNNNIKKCQKFENHIVFDTEINIDFLKEYLSNQFLLSRKRKQAMEILYKKEKLAS